MREAPGSCLPVRLHHLPGIPYSVYIFLFPDCAISFIISTFISAWQSLTHPSKPCLNISSSRKVPALSRRVIIYAVPPAVCDRTYQNVVKSTGLLTCHSLSFHWEFLKVKVYILFISDARHILDD